MFFVNLPEVAARQQWRHLCFNNKNVTLNCRKSLVT